MKTARYQKQVRQCAAEFRAMLPELSGRHTPLVLIAALTEHVGGGLFLSQATHECSLDQARAIVQRVKDLALAEEA
jgi:hypothetical protein